MCTDATLRSILQLAFATSKSEYPYELEWCIPITSVELGIYIVQLRQDDIHSLSVGLRIIDCLQLGNLIPKPQVHKQSLISALIHLCQLMWTCTRYEWQCIMAIPVTTDVYNEYLPCCVHMCTPVSCMASARAYMAWFSRFGNKDKPLHSDSLAYALLEFAEDILHTS